ETLPGDQRAVFLLRVRHEMPVREIAHILCVPEGTVKSRFHHAVRKLRAYVDEKDGHSSKENDDDDLFGSTPAPDRARVRRARYRPGDAGEPAPARLSGVRRGRSASARAEEFGAPGDARRFADAAGADRRGTAAFASTRARRPKAAGPRLRRRRG